MFTNRNFRRVLNLSMAVTILGTVPYMLGGQTQYRHEVFGTAAFILVLYHCIENRFWFRQCPDGKPRGNQRRGSSRFRDRITLLLLISTLVLAVSGIMISNVVFRFLRIPYFEFWHYIHFASGIAFLVLVAIHAHNHRRRKPCRKH